MKLCKDCRWCTKHSGELDDWPRAECHAPANYKWRYREWNPDNPPQADTWRSYYCEDHRWCGNRFVAWMLGICGKRGRWFEPKEQP